jgi:hypothetical protein
MKSFRQYIQEIVTDKPKSAPKHVYWSEDFPVGFDRHSLTQHNYNYEHPNQGEDKDKTTSVNIKTRHKKGVKNHTSHFSFSTASTNKRTGEYQHKTARTGKESAETAMKVLGHAVHAGSHHIRKHKPKYFSFDVSKSEGGKSARSKGARKNIYHKIMNRTAEKHGYELHNIKQSSRTQEKHTYKRIEK